MEQKDFPHMLWVNERIHQYCQQGIDLWEAIDKVRKENECKLPMSDIKEYDDD